MATAMVTPVWRRQAGQQGQMRYEVEREEVQTGWNKVLHVGDARKWAS
jgi:hypothetical protein